MGGTNATGRAPALGRLEEEEPEVADDGEDTLPALAHAGRARHLGSGGQSGIVLSPTSTNLLPELERAQVSGLPAPPPPPECPLLPQSRREPRRPGQALPTGPPPVPSRCQSQHPGPDGVTQGVGGSAGPPLHTPHGR